MAMPYSLHQAATACGVNKSTILRAIKAGKISAVRDEQGQWQVEPAELHRVYPPVTDAAERTDRCNDTHRRMQRCLRWRISGQRWLRNGCRK
jgi:predicted site-specific integrase-resolvase